MRKLFFLLLFVVSWFHGFAQKITFSEHIAPIIYNNCSYCHHKGAIGPFSLTSFNDVYTQRYLIANDVIIHKMPPWPPDPNFKRLSHERLITQNQIDLIKAWVDSGAVRGDSTKEPSAPVYNNASVLKNVSLSKTIPTYTVEANTDIYRCFAIPSGTNVNKVLTGLEFIPGNRKIVHHILLYWDTTGACAKLDAADPKPGYLHFGGVGSNSAILIGGWVPGSSAMILPTNMGMTIPAGADLVIQIHYAPGNIGAEDSTSFNIQFTNATGLREVYQQPALNHFTSLLNGPLYIPADSIKTFKEEITVPIDVSVIGIAPHMHLIGKNIKVYGIAPVSGDTIPLIKINKWDFHWQGFYQFNKVVVLKKGTSVYAEATYDNTSNNPNNPNSPPKDVQAGESTTDEMMIVYFSFLYYQSGDENIVLDSNSLTGININELPASVRYLNIYPNPIIRPNDINLGFELQSSGVNTIQIFNMNGIQVYTKSYNLSEGKNSIIIHSDKLASGTYICKLFNKDGLITQKIIVR